MLTLGIDPGIATTGYGVIKEKDGKLFHVVSGCVTTCPRKTSENRLARLYYKLKDIIAEFKPGFLAVESIFFGKNRKTAILVSQARGIVLLLAAKASLQVVQYTPLEVKLAVTGYGKAEKSQIQQMVKTLLNLPRIPKPDDAADALAVAICHLHSHKLNSLINPDFKLV